MIESIASRAVTLETTGETTPVLELSSLRQGLTLGKSLYYAWWSPYANSPVLSGLLPLPFPLNTSCLHAMRSLVLTPETQAILVRLRAYQYPLSVCGRSAARARLRLKDLVRQHVGRSGVVPYERGMARAGMPCRVLTTAHVRAHDRIRVCGHVRTCG